MNERARINYNGCRYTNKDLFGIGNQVASLWGASCYDFKVIHKEKEVWFFCSEHGEFFQTCVKFDELTEYHK